MDNILETYQERAFALAIYPNKEKDLVYPILGLIGEFSEYQRSSRNETELGDFLWYVCALLTTMDESFCKAYTEVKHRQSIIRRFQGNITPKVGLPHVHRLFGQICERVKKTIRDENNILTDDNKQRIYNYLIDILVEVLWYYSFSQDLADVLSKNLEKLEKRTKEGKLKGEGSNR